MAFVAGAVVAAIGLTGTAAAVGTALVGAAISVGLGMAARALAPKPEQGGGTRGRELSLRLDTDVPRQLVFGETATGGSMVYFNTYGSNNKHLELVIALADHPCKALTGFYVDGEAVTWDSGTGKTDEYGDDLVVEFFDGAVNQAASSDLVDNGGSNWTSNDRGAGVAYVRVQLTYSEEKFPNGIPSFRWIVQGAKLYDWRKDDTNGGSGSHRWDDPSTYEYSDNPVLAWYNYRRGIVVGDQRMGGMSTPASAIDHDAATAAANACEESVDLKAGGTETRYRIGAAVDTSRTHREVIRDFVACFAGREVDSGGKVAPIAGVARASVMSITDDDLIAEESFEYTGKLPRSELVNAVFGDFADPSSQYETTSLPPRISTADEQADGDVRLEQSYSLPFVTSATQGQRILEIFRRLNRRQARVEMTGRGALIPLEAGDWISWTSDRYGWTNKLWEVVSAPVTSDALVQLSLREIDSDIYTWNEQADELDLGNPAVLSSGTPGLTALQGLSAQHAEVQVSGSDIKAPALSLTWTPPDDPTVDAIAFQYREVGSASALEHTTFDTEAGSVVIGSGVQSGASYEVRARLKTVPQRGTVFGPWIPASGTAGAQVVDTSVNAQEASGVADEAIDEDALSEQLKFELSLVTQADEVFGSVSQAANNALEAAELAAEETIANQIGGFERQDDVTDVRTIVAGVQARWGVAIDVAGNIVGLVQLEGTATQSQFTVVADKFLVAQPDDGNGGAVPVFTIANVNGSPKLVLRGDMLADGTITAQALDVGTLDAITADIGTITAGVLKSADDKMIIDLNNKTLTIET